MRMKIMVRQKKLNLEDRFKEDQMASFSFGDTANGANVFTPLGFATYHDQSHIIEILLQAGADKEDKFEIGGELYTPVEYAEKREKKKALKVLTTYKIKPPRAGSAAAAAAAASTPATAAATSASATPAKAEESARSAPVQAERTMILFPGQGAQKVGMGKGLESYSGVKEMISKAKEIMGFDLWDVCHNGPEERLNTTLISQPALYLVSLAALQKVKSDDKVREANTVVVCGLSLGEYTALAYAGVVSFEDGLRLVKARAEAMQKAADAAPSGMVSVLGVGMDVSKVEKLCEAATKSSGDKIVVANALCLGNTAVSGSIKACDEVVKLGEKYGATKVVKLAVAGAFHSDFMKPASEELNKTLQAIEFHSPQIPVVFNVDAQEETDGAKIKEKLLSQLVSPVLWEKSILYAINKFDISHAVEVGPGNVLTGIMRRVLKEYKGGKKKPTPKAVNV